jgi:dihydropteroate synthase
MQPFKTYSLNLKGHQVTIDRPWVMGIVNVTPDSFYSGSRVNDELTLAERVRSMIADGADVIDVGACSTRPDSEPATEQEEMERLRIALPIVRREAPDAVVSVDTFRPNIARMAVEEYGADIINDVEGGKEMFRMVSRLRVPYIYMSRKSTMKEVMLDCAKVVDMLRSMGQKDIILDPGFGFGKTVEQNYRVFGELERMQALHLPVLVGISRKSVIWKLLRCTPAEALNSTTVLNTLALVKGASILRVHDVKEAVECVKITQQLEKVK